MRGGLAAKALFMIAIIVLSTFTVSNLKPVAAEEDEANNCCERTEDGDYCVYTAESSCDDDYLQASTTCEQTTFCEPGCCVSDIGQCSKSVSKSTCENTEGYSWEEGADCSVDACQKECCVIAEYQCSYTTEKHCEYLITDLEDIELDWRDVDSEAECTDICRASDKGCCVDSEGGCTYGTQGECAEPDIDYEEGTGFYTETYCSDLSSCECIAHDSKQCVDEDVYYVDTCGNLEEVYEDCDYLGGTWCGYDEELGDYGCLDIDCDTQRLDGYETFPGIYYVDTDNPGEVGDSVPRNTHDNRIGGERQHGESWCLYESPAGAFKDFPGSQHYRAYCYFGEEIVEPCADFREEVCLQVPYTNYRVISDDLVTWEEESYSGDYDGPTGSACIDNTDNTLFNPNVTTVSVGAPWDDSGLADTCAQASIDCTMTYAISSWTDPTYQPGLGVMCTSPQWAKAMSEYCRSFGDCGGSMNLAGKYTNDGFYMSSSVEFLTANDDKNESNKVYVGYDSCVDHFIEGSADAPAEYGTWLGVGSENKFEKQIEATNNREQEAVFCLYGCDERSGGCTLISRIDEEFYDTYYLSEEAQYYQHLGVLEEDDPLIVTQDFPDISFEDDLGDRSYGVYGGLVGVSQLYGDVAPGTVSAHLFWPTALGVTSAAGSLAYAGLLASLGFVATEPTTWKALAGWAGQEAGILGAETAATSALIIGGIVTIVTTITNWVVISNTANPIERQQQTQTFAITSTIAASVTLISLYVAAAAGTIGPVGWVVSIVAIVVAGIAAIVSYGGKTADVTITSNCQPWQPPTGSDYCELCDIPVSDGGLAFDDGEGNVLTGWECTEYKCRSLGQNCEFISENLGTTRPKCIGVEANDVNHPLIEEAYLLGDYEDLDYDFVPDDYLIVNEDVDPYTFFEFGIELDEPGQCKIDNGVVTDDYESMSLAFPDSYYDYVHNQTWILTPDEKYTFYIRCQDHNGNYNIDAFVIQVETSSGDDITTPTIEATSVTNGAYIAADVNETPVSVFINEPAECKWSSTNAEYSLMENYMVCSGIPSSASPLFENECTAYLPVNLSTNYYYFACQDAAGNANTENYAFTLVGTEPLNIDYVLPNGTIYYDYVTLQVETSVGAESGIATCSYGGIEFFNTGTTVHTQPLQDLSAGDYVYDIDCVDVAGNTNSSQITFTIVVDADPPELTSVYKLESSVYFTTDESSSCEYYFEEFTYGAGTDVSGSFTLTDVLEYYLKCQDVFGNEAEWVIRV